LSEDVVEWSHSGTWRVAIDQSLGNGCFMIASYMQGEIFRIGVSNTHKNGYVMLANPAWSSLEVGKQYKLSFQFDGEPPWTGNFTAVQIGNAVALTNFFDKGTFLQDIGVKQALSVWFNGKFVTRMPLTGTYAAVQSLVQCQERVNQITAGSARPADPFRGNNVKPANDPFR
jgi:hypothetical protein